MTTTTKFKSNVHITGNLRVDGTTTMAGEVRSPYDHDGVGNGVADDTAAIQAAIDYLYDNCGGGQVDLAGGRWLVDSANIVMRTGTSLVGPWRTAASGIIGTADIASMDYSTVKGAIVLNPLYTIVCLEDCTGIAGLHIIRKGLAKPTSLRTAVDIAVAFSGTAITVGSGVSGTCDQYLGYCNILGFEYAYKVNWAARTVIEYVRGDCTNGVDLNHSHDMQHLSHCHFFPFTTHGYAPGSYAVSATANNGSGLIRLTIASHVMQTGDIINVQDVTGTTEANGRWTVTVINATTIDLQGSTFANAWVSGGTAHLSPWRRGIAYQMTIVDWGQADHCFSFGYDIGFNIDGASSHCELLNCGVDHNSSGGDDTTIGIRIGDVINTQLIGCKTAAVGKGVLVDTQSGNKFVSIVGHDAWGTRVCGIHVLSGGATISSSLFYGTPVGILVDDEDGDVMVFHNRVVSVTTPMTIGGAALRTSQIFSNNWSTGGEYLRTFTTREHYFADYTATAAGYRHIMRKARGSPAVPTAALSGDVSLYLRGEFWDGVSAFQVGGLYRIEATATTTDTASPAKHVWGVTPTGSVTVADEMALDFASLSPVGDLGLTLGTATARWSIVYSRFLSVMDPPVAAPGTVAGTAFIYVDPADGDLKVKFGDGTIKTIVVDT